MTAEHDSGNTVLDQAIAQRLRRLRTMPVDTTRLERSLRTQIGPVVAGRHVWATRGLRLLRAAAAVLGIALILTAVLLGSLERPVMASPAEMAAMHRDLVSGRVPVMRADTVEAANAMLADQWPRNPGLPQRWATTQSPQEHVMACCMRSVKDRKVACLLVNSQGVPVTVSVAKASEMRVKMPPSCTVVRGPVTYSIQAVENLQMVTFQRDGRWVCLMGELPPVELITLGERLEFR